MITVADENTAGALLNDELDKAMKKFKAKEPAFFNEYTSARMIIDLGGRSQKPVTLRDQHHRRRRRLH